MTTSQQSFSHHQPQQPASSAAHKAKSGVTEKERRILKTCFEYGAKNVGRVVAAGGVSLFTSLEFGEVFRELVRLTPSIGTIDLDEYCASENYGRLGGREMLEYIMTAPSSVFEFVQELDELVHSRRAQQIMGKIDRARLLMSDGDVENAVACLRDLITNSRPKSSCEVRDILSFAVPPDNDPNTLLGDRLLCRGDAMIIAAQAGCGKSALAIQAAITWALGRAFFGIRPAKALKSLIVQAEDSDGDVGEVTASICHCMQLTAAECDQVRANVHIVRMRTQRGDAFFSEVRGLVEAEKPDIVWLNPLLSFMSGPIADQEATGAFLRAGLNSLNDGPNSFAWIAVHHTNKPPTGKDIAEKKWSEWMYEMSGSSELTNWARAVIAMPAGEVEGTYNLVLAKRGKRADIKDALGAPITKVSIQHTTRPPIMIQGREKPLPLIFWERAGSAHPKLDTVQLPIPPEKKKAYSAFANIGKRTSR